jgi:deazaflavin-dependent oxidoreductase (nitroreductase family)
MAPSDTAAIRGPFRPGSPIRVRRLPVHEPPVARRTTADYDRRPANQRPIVEQRMADQGGDIGPLDGRLAALEVCDLVTTGRRSGQPREIEIWFAADPERPTIYLLSGGRDQASWVRNLRANPAVLVRLDGRELHGRAREVEGGPHEDRARRLVAGKYGYWRTGEPFRGWARDSLPVAIDLEDA